jgi:hypothetical protein
MTKKGRLLWVVVLVVLWLLCTGTAQAGALTDRLERFPHWHHKPTVEKADGDLLYPAWFEGDWRVTTTLVDLSAPLAPSLITPGFKTNQTYLNQPITFNARFIQEPMRKRRNSPFLLRAYRKNRAQPIVADRAFNGLNLTQAYLRQSLGDQGDRLVVSVDTDPNNPNRQLMRGDRQLISTVTGRWVEPANTDQFVATEMVQQLFQGIPQPYVNEVETTTAYQHHPDETPEIVADQVTAIYLSPQDPDYFKANGHPVALYRYRLEFLPPSAQR